MEKIGTRISDIEASLEVLKANSQQIQDKIGEKPKDSSPALQAQSEALMRLKELAEDTSERIQQIPK